MIWLHLHNSCERLPEEQVVQMKVSIAQQFPEKLFISPNLVCLFLG
jgi:hypothetical protein